MRLTLWACLLCLLALASARNSEPVVTYVTGLYDIGRGKLKSWGRPFDYYLNFFKVLLSTPHNLVVYGEKDLE